MAGEGTICPMPLDVVALKSSQRLPQVLRHRVCRHPHRLGREMCVAIRGLDLRVAEQLADHWQTLTRGDGRGRKGVA